MINLNMIASENNPSIQKPVLLNQMSIAVDSSCEPDLCPPPSSLTLEGLGLSSSKFSLSRDFELALIVVNDLVFAKRSKYLTEAELVIVKGALNNLDYEEIASNSTYSLNYLQRCVAPQLWDTLSETIGNGEKVSKKKLWYFLEQVNKKYHIQSVSGKEETDTASKDPSYTTNDVVRVVRGQLPDLSSFYGRKQELIHLKKIIANHRCISLVGVAGIGKSALAAKLLTELNIESQCAFDYLIWKSVSHAPPLQELIGDLIELTCQSSKPELALPQSNQAMISVLIKQLQSHHCLLVLDGFEALFQMTSFQQRLEYGIFLKRLIEEEHQSCLLLTSRFLPDELDILLKAKSYIQSIKVEGLDTDAAKQFLSFLGVNDKENSNDLIKTYCGNPLELKAIANRIGRFFGGNAKKFLENKTTLISSEFKAVLDEMFSQILTDIQRQIMVCIAEELILNGQPITFGKLLKSLNQNSQICVSTSELILAIEKLERLSLIETDKDNLTKEINFTLQPVIKKYIKTDPQGLVHTSDSSRIAIAS